MSLARWNDGRNARRRRDTGRGAAILSRLCSWHLFDPGAAIPLKVVRIFAEIGHAPWHDRA